MSFIYPSFLFALFAVSIPVIIHLFNFRRFKKVYFPDIRFLKEVKQQTQNRNRLRHLLILLARILAVSFLVLAFAQPYIPADRKQAVTGVPAVSIYVDNSFSMENVSKNGMLLNEAKKLAREIALAHLETDRFQLLTNDFEGKHQRWVSREEFLSMLDEVKVSPAVKTISQIASRQSDMLQKAETRNRKAFIISDYQKSFSDFEKIKADTGIRTILLPVTSNEQNNLYVDSCWFESPVHPLNQPEKLMVRIRNLSPNPLENVPVKLFLNNQQKTPSSYSIGPGETKVIPLSFVIREPGIQQGKIEIADYPVTYDDKFYFSFEVLKNIPVACIASAQAGIAAGKEQSKEAIRSLFGKDSLFVFSMQDENKLDYSSLASQQVIILDELKSISSGLMQELNRFVTNGGSLVVFPSVDADTASYKAFLTSFAANFYLKKDTADTKVDWVNYESEIFSGVFDATQGKGENIDLPVVRQHYEESRSTRTSEEVELKLKNGNPFFSSYSYKRGKVYLSAVPLNPDWSNLSRHAIFVPLMYRIALNSQPSADLFYTIGQDGPIDVKTRGDENSAALAGENVFKIKGASPGSGAENFEVIPESRIVDLRPVIFVHDQIKNAGNYLLFSGNERLSGLSFNYDRKESDLNHYAPDELVSLYERFNLPHYSLIDSENKNLTKVLADISQGKKLWKWCIVLVLAFLAVETLLLRLWK